MVVAGRAVTSLPGRQGRALFAYLALHRDRPVAREELIVALWPENAPADPGAAFASVLARVRQAVGREAISGRSELQLQLADAEIDTEVAIHTTSEAEQRLRHGDHAGAWAAAEKARRIVARPLLPGLEAPWLDTAREDLSELEARALEAMSRAGLADPALDGAGAARALVERHPYRESGYTLLMELQAQRGDVAEALNTYHRLRTFLVHELGTGPSAAARALHERLLRAGELVAAPAAAPPLPAPLESVAARAFVGRDTALAALRASWGAGSRRLALLMGEAGIGKTRIAAQFAAEVHGSGATVLYGRCEEDPVRSYEPFVAALRHYLRHGDWASDASLRRELRELAWLIPEASPDDPPETERSRLFDAVATLLARAARSAPAAARARRPALGRQADAAAPAPPDARGRARAAADPRQLPPERSPAARARRRPAARGPGRRGRARRIRPGRGRDADRRPAGRGCLARVRARPAGPHQRQSVLHRGVAALAGRGGRGPLRRARG